MSLQGSVDLLLKGFKPDITSGFTTSTIIDFQFEEYRYGVRVSNQDIRYWPYDQYLSDEDKISILRQVGNPLYDEIEPMVNRANKNKS